MPDPSPPPKSFTGRKRQKKTRFAVRAADFISTRLITIGGIGTILAVSLVAVLLVAVTFPLFSSASISHPLRGPLAWKGQQPLYVSIDEYQTMGWALYPDGTLHVFELDTGKEVASHALFHGKAKLTAVSVIPDTSIGDTQAKDTLNLQVAAGFDDGTIRLGTIGFQTSFSEVADVPAELRKMGIGEVALFGEGVVQVTPQRQFRRQQVVYDFHKPIKFATAPIEMLAHGHRIKNFGVAAYAADGKLAFGVAEQLVNTLTKTTSYRVSSKLKTELNYDFAKRGRPDHLLVPTRGNMAYCVWKDGHCARFDARVIADAQLAEELELLEGPDREVTVLRFALNRETLLVGDSKGTVRGWFPVDRGDVVHLNGALPTKDRLVLAPVHTLPSRDVAITSLGISQRTRMIAVGYEDGLVRVFHVTTDQAVIDVHPAEDSPIDFVALSPKDNGIIATSAEGMWRCEFEAGHPETTFASLFFPVWYEGDAKPDVKWQSSFAGVGPEMKLSLWPLVFGTLKATLYAMLFGAPLALLAAIYTSEFMRPRLKATIKPVVEMMASLPSVVLGFLAALVFAPYVERAVPMTLSCFVAMPFVYVLTAFLWQLLPQQKSLALQHYRFLFCLLLIPIGLALAWLLGPVVEDLFFAGDIMLWLDGQIGTGTGAWMMMLLPLTALAIAVASGLFANSWLRRSSGQWSRQKFAAVNLAKFLGAAVLTLAVAWLLSALLTAVGFDPRGTYVDTYDQRNALVVGFVMGFAIIPIIYTIADDALSTVPYHLRTASLGAGATPWQTTIRIVIPTAMSGLFSALMIGLGRAVGETMIVLMAGGNTPVRDWNIFNGFRTLAANIAVELPEAVKDQTHYRTLFLCALTLFVMTFFVNTLAELVRLRFRKRAVQL